MRLGSSRVAERERLEIPGRRGGSTKRRRTRPRGQIGGSSEAVGDRTFLQLNRLVTARTSTTPRARSIVRSTMRTARLVAPDLDAFETQQGRQDLSGAGKDTGVFC